MALTLTAGQGRVFHTTLGHGPLCHRTPAYQKLVVQGVEWAAGKR
jgi:type 1 glutamine amidotransferase